MESNTAITNTVLDKRGRFNEMISISQLKKTFTSDEFFFRISTSFKMLLPALLSFSFLAIYLWNLMAINLIFLEANGYPGLDSLKEAYFEYVLATLVDKGPYVVLASIIIAIAGLYLSKLMLRPFRVIAQYCDDITEGRKGSYDPDFFSDLRLLTRFSEYFFNIMENAEKNEKLVEQEIPKNYMRIHKPVFETGFFFQQFFFILIVSILASVGISIISSEVYHNIVALATDHLKNATQMGHFLGMQKKIFDDVTTVIVILNVLFYIILSLHFYSKVAAPAFGIFSTMRSFVKGGYDARVHLLGFYYLRAHCRTINRYLKHMKTFTVEK